MISQPVPAEADTANVLSLVISQLKITSSNGQFVTLYNPTENALDMSKYQLEYFNSYDLGKATTSRLITLAGTLPPHGYYMVNDSSLLLCYQLTVNSLSLGFSSTAGMIEVLAFNQASAGGPVIPELQDYVGWSKTAAAGAQTLPANTNAFLQRQPLDSGNHPAVSVPGAGSWQTVQPDAKNPCNLLTGTSAPAATGLSQLLPAVEPPATLAELSGDSGSDAVTPSGLPPGDIGLMAPQISELLPNPAGTGNDSTDEFIELYNPNDKAFDLSGFSLQTGLSTFRNYAFPAGTSLPPRSWTSFYSETTGLSLSNTSSMAKLLEPGGNSVSASSQYSSAKDGQSWALAKGKWYWTTFQTPNAANVIKQPVAAKKSVASKSKSSKSTTSKTSKSKSSTDATTGFGRPAEEPPTSPIHLGTLVLVAGLAVVYGLYEYRVDVANRIHRARRYFADWRGNRSKFAWRRTD